MSFHGIAYGILRERPSKIYPWSASLRERLIKSGIGVSHVVYISSMFFWTGVVTLLGLLVPVVLFSMVFPVMGVEMPGSAVVMWEVVTPLAAGALTFVIYQYYPSYKMGERKTEIEKNLVHVANFMGILSSAGATSEDVFLALVRAGKIYGIEKSTRGIIRDVEIFGKDILTALDDESKRSPSSDYVDLLQGYISTVATGGEVAPYLSAMSNQFLESRRRLLTRIIEQLNLTGEIFVAALIALPVILITLLSIMGFFGGTSTGGLSPPQLMMVVVYAMIPVLAIVIIILIDSILSSW